MRAVGGDGHTGWRRALEDGWAETKGSARHRIEGPRLKLGGRRRHGDVEHHAAIGEDRRGCRR